MYDPNFKIWGYETNWGSFAQFARVQAHQCMRKAAHLTWEEAAGPTLVGATAYRMLMGWPPHVVRRDDVVLIWGASGGLGCIFFFNDTATTEIYALSLPPVLHLQKRALQ